MKIVSENRRAKFDYEIGQKFEAGIMLVSSEVKSLRNGQCTIAESYITVKNNEVFLINSNFPEYLQANRFNHEPKRHRKLLLKSKEIAKLSYEIERAGMTIIPLKIYFNDKNRAKIEIAIAKGKKNYDKRETEKKKDWNREKIRLLKKNNT